MDVRYRPLDWPAGQPRTPHPTSSLFRSSWSQTLDLLDSELWHLGAKEVVIEGGWRPRDIRIDGMPRADAPQPNDPAIVLSFDSKFGPLRYACDTYRHWQDNVRAIAMSLEALRAVDRWGISKRGEQYRGWGELPSGIATEPPMTPEEAAAFIVRWADFSDQPGIQKGDLLAHLLSDPDAYLTSMYRRAAKVLHPDLGGPTAEFQKLDRAKRRIEEYAETSR